jgi:adenylate cyclase
MLFTDIRNFTTYSESGDAIMILDHLNTYMTALTSRIMETSGTIDKYIGDSVMAYWGAPLFDPEHEDRALNAAFAMVIAAQRLDRRVQDFIAPINGVAVSAAGRRR